MFNFLLMKYKVIKRMKCLIINWEKFFSFWNVVCYDWLVKKLYVCNFKCDIISLVIMFFILVLSCKFKICRLIYNMYWYWVVIRF